MIQIKRLHGTEEELYRLVAPLVMDPVVLKQNYNFLFRTSVPLECKRTECVINNYYVKGKDATVLEVLLTSVVDAFKDRVLAAVAFKEDVDMFRRQGFLEEKAWTRYVRMKKEPGHGERQ